MEVSREIGSGGFGSVFECRLSDGTTLALKRLHPDADVQDVERFRREVRLQTMLDSPYIVPVVHDLLDDDPPGFTMPLAAGSLEDYVNSSGPSLDLVVAVRQVAEALSVAHASNVIHRDLSPRNVLRFPAVGESLRFAVADFGLGILLDDMATRLTRTVDGLGTIAYIAPEQIRDLRSADRRSDIYSLGKLLYFVLVGQVPFPNMDMGQLPERYRYVVRKSCDPDPRRRFSCIEEFVRDLERLEAADGEQADPVVRFEEVLRAIELGDDANVHFASELLAKNLANRAFLLRALPLLSIDVLTALWEDDSVALETALDAFDRAVAGELGFSYCDTVAHFYSRVFRAIDSNALKSMLLHRLLRIGYSHNRWHVRTVVSGMVRETTDSELLMGVASELQADPGLAEWHTDANQYLTERGYLN